MAEFRLMETNPMNGKRGARQGSIALNIKDKMIGNKGQNK
jgi:hypothetical protein